MGVVSSSGICHVACYTGARVKNVLRCGKTIAKSGIFSFSNPCFQEQHSPNTDALRRFYPKSLWTRIYMYGISLKFIVPQPIRQSPVNIPDDKVSKHYLPLRCKNEATHEHRFKIQVNCGRNRDWVCDLLRRYVKKRTWICTSQEGSEKGSVDFEFIALQIRIPNIGMIKNAVVVIWISFCSIDQL